MTHIPDEADLKAVEEQVGLGVPTDPGDVLRLITEIRRVREKPNADELMNCSLATGALFIMLGDPRLRELYPSLGRVVTLDTASFGRAGLEIELGMLRSPYRLFVERVPDLEDR